MTDGVMESAETKILPQYEPWQLPFDEYLTEYEFVMQNVGLKERKGGLDPADRASYQPMTEEEHELMAKDWREFSRSRGFSEEDIEEYERWLTLSGQRDFPDNSYNDHWRRVKANVPEGYTLNSYKKHSMKVQRCHRIL